MDLISRMPKAQAGVLASAALLFAAASYTGRPLLLAAGAVAMVAVVGALMRPLWALYASLALLPLEAVGRVIASQPALTWSKVALVLSLGGFLMQVLVRRETLDPPPRLWALMGVMAVGVAASVLGPAGATIETAKNTAAVLTNIIMVVLAYALIRNERSFSLGALAVAAGSVPVVVFGVIEVFRKEALFPNPVISEPLWAPGTTSTFRITSTFYDPNVLARYLVFAALWTLAALWLPGLRRWRPMLLAVLAGQVFCVVNTFSRGGLITMTLIAAPFVLVRLMRSRKPSAIALGSAMIIGGAIALKPLVAITLSRFGDTTAGGRFGIWEKALPVLSANPLLGVGRENIPASLAVTFGRPIDPHNLYLELLLATGAVGVLLALAWAAPLFQELLCAWRMRDPHAVLVALPLIGVLVFGLSLQGMDGYELWIPFAFALPALSLARSRKGGQECA